MIKSLNIELEKAIRLLVEHAPVSDEKSRKPLLPHDIRVGVYLYENGYSRAIVLAGILHDTIEFTDITKEILKSEFGEEVLKLVLASTKNDLIIDKFERTEELIKRCVENGQDALIVKTADIIDSFKYYSAVKNGNELEYCMRNARAIFKYKPEDFNDKIFETLKQWTDRDKL
jgi:(p)ppGpp synthase/HD superfamily hydrolase